MPQMGTVPLLFRSDRGGGFTGGDRIAAHRILEPRRREDEHQADRLGARVLCTDPGLSRNKNQSPRMEIALLVAEPNVSLAGLNQQDFILIQVPVLRYRGSGRKFLGARDKMLRTVVFGTHFQHELRGSRAAGVSVNAASSQFALVLFQQKRLSLGLWAWNCVGLTRLRERTGQPDHYYDRRNRTLY